MRTGTALAATMMLGLVAAAASAQDRPFVFSLSTASDTSKTSFLVDYEVGVGEGTFRQQADGGPEQRVGVQASIGRLTFIGRVGVVPVNSSYQTSQQGEALFSVAGQDAFGVALAAGGGMLHEAGGTDVVLARVVAAREGERTRLLANLLFQKPLSSERDAVDLITTFGWGMKVSPSMSLGVEAIGEDLEGFWEENEAEGGARLLVGPSLHIAPSARRWQLSVAAGPTFHPTRSARVSDALRNLPQTTKARGYAVRTLFAYSF